MKGLTRTLAIQTGPAESTTVLITEPTDVQADNLPLSTWGSSFILANRLHALAAVPTPVPARPLGRDPFARAEGAATVAAARESEGSGTTAAVTVLPVLELGAGTALVGLTAAMLWGTCAVLTDVAGIVPGLRANIAINAEESARRGARVYGGTLDWSKPETASIVVPRGARGDEKSDVDEEEEEEEEVVVLKAGECRARTIVAADVVYSEDHPPLLTQTILAWLMPGDDARVILAYPLRIAYLDHIRDLWERLENAGLECVEEGKDEENNEESWDEPAPYEWCVWKWKAS